MSLPAEPNGLWWSATDGAVYFASDETHAVYRRERSGSITIAANVPPPVEGKGGLGQLVITRDGTIVIPRFGGGSAGGVVFIRRDGTSGSVPNLDPMRRRIGLALADDGALYDSYFNVDDDMKQFRGAIARLTLDGGEVDILHDLQKPVGVLVEGKRLIVSDQKANRIMQATLPAVTDARMLAENVDAPDLLAPGPNGAVFAGGRNGAVYRVEIDGRVKTMVTGLRAIRGVAFDPALSRLFVVERGDRARALPATLRVISVER